jgi:hypothetical protein
MTEPSARPTAISSVTPFHATDVERPPASITVGVYVQLQRVSPAEVARRRGLGRRVCLTTGAARAKGDRALLVDRAVTVSGDLAWIGVDPDDSGDLRRHPGLLTQFTDRRFRKPLTDLHVPARKRPVPVVRTLDQEQLTDRVEHRDIDHRSEVVGTWRIG